MDLPSRIKTEVEHDGYGGAEIPTAGYNIAAGETSVEKDWSKKRSKLHSLLFTRTNSPVPPEVRSASPAANLDSILEPVIKSEPLEDVNGTYSRHQSQVPECHTDGLLHGTNTTAGKPDNSSSDKIIFHTGNDDTDIVTASKHRPAIHGDSSVRDVSRSSLLKSVLTCPMDMLGRTGLMDSPPIVRSDQTHASMTSRDAELRKMLAAPISCNTTYSSATGHSSPSLYHNLLTSSPQRESAASPLMNQLRSSNSPKGTIEAKPCSPLTSVVLPHRDSPQTVGKPIKVTIDSIVESELAKMKPNVNNHLTSHLSGSASACDLANIIPVPDRPTELDDSVLYICDICHMTFQHKGTLKVHRRGHGVKAKSKKSKSGKYSPNDCTKINDTSADLIDRAIKIELDRDESPVLFDKPTLGEGSPTLGEGSMVNPADEEDGHVDSDRSNSPTHPGTKLGKSETDGSKPLNVKRKFLSHENPGQLEDSATQYEADSCKKSRLHDKPVVIQDSIHATHSTLLSHIMAKASDSASNVDKHTQHCDVQSTHVTHSGDTRVYSKYTSTYDDDSRSNVDKHPATRVDHNRSNGDAVEVITIKEEPVDHGIDTTFENNSNNKNPIMLNTKTSDTKHGGGNRFTNNNNILTSMLNTHPLVTRAPLDQPAVATTGNVLTGNQRLTGADRMFADLHEKSRVSDGQLDGDGRLTFPLYQCRTCSANFQHAGTLRVHERSHESKVKCPICSKCVTDMRYLKVHMRTHKPEPVVRVSATYSEPSQLYTAPDTVTTTPVTTATFECYICHLVLTNVDNFQLHLRSHTDEKLHECPDCHAGFTRESQLHVHSRIHTGERPFSCSLCQMTFRQKGGLKLHMSTHTPDKPYKCHLCDGSFGRKAHLDRHLRYHTGDRPYTCTKCMKTFIELGNLQQHLKRKHAFDGKLTKCNDCRKYFISESELQEHMTDCDNNHVTGDSGDDITSIDTSMDGGYDVEQNQNTPDNRECYVCRQVFPDNSSLQSHMETKHFEKSLQCPTCPRTFGSKSLLNVHMNKCRRLLACPICDEKFFEISLLQEHLDSHKDSEDVKPDVKPVVLPAVEDVNHSDAKFVCNICEAVMPTKLALLTHYHEHSENFHLCAFCSRKFLTKKALTGHINSEHENARYGCKFCDKTYKQIRYLTRHVQSTHKDNATDEVDNTDDVDTGPQKHRVLANPRGLEENGDICGDQLSPNQNITGDNS